jgi:aldehyde dehydrogenase (NAD+)
MVLHKPSKFPKIQFKKLLINNHWVESTSGRFIDVINPATEEVICTVSEATSEDVDKAVSAAHQAYHKSWNFTSAENKSQLLFRVAQLIENSKDELALLESLNNGKPLIDAEWDVSESAKCFQYYAGWVDKIQGTTLPLHTEYTTHTRRESIGVCGLISPWNYPLLIAAWKLAPALACGNTVILKPS